MAIEIPVFDLGIFTAITDLSAKQYRAVKIGTTGHIEVAGAGVASIGILKDNPYGTSTAPVSAAVAVLGVHPAEYGDTVTGYLTALTPDSVGRLVPATTNDVVVAYALETGTSGGIYNVMILPRMISGSFPSASQGAVVYASGTNTWAALGVGTDHQFLMTQGAAANPKWSNVYGEFTLAIPIDLNSITTTQDVVTNYTLGYIGTINKVDAIVNKPVSTGSKGATLNLEIGTTNLTGGVVTLTSAGCNTMGTVVAGTTVSGNNTFVAADTLSVEATGVTQFSEGSITLLIHITPTVGGA
jgi:hypothetical protein